MEGTFSVGLMLWLRGTAAAFLQLARKQSVQHPGGQ